MSTAATSTSSTAPAAAVKSAPATSSSSSSSSSDAKAAQSKPSVIHSVAVLRANDAQLKANAKWAAATPKYEPFLASDEAVAKTKAALEEKKHKVTVVDSPAAALAAITGDALPKGASVAFGGSITLEQIGLIDTVKARDDLKNYRAEALAAMAKGDFPGSMALRYEGTQKAEYFFTSVAAVTESGELVNADASGTRTAPMLSGAKNVVIVVSANKIVADLAAAIKRLEEWVVPIEGAHMRAAMGLPDTNYYNLVVTRGCFTPGRFHVVIVKGHALGY